MSDMSHCPKCGAQLPEDAPEGLCPKCLVQAGLESKDQAKRQPDATVASPGSGFEPPSVEELARAFPQLEILELLGTGGMGAVYKARQPGLDRLVAVKILPPEVGNDPAFAERFTREARAMARLSHPNIVGVHDFGHTEDFYYIVMEYVDGANLRQTMQAGKLRPEEALAIVPQICDALQYAHDEGVLHRDIKPENILLDKKGRLKIADFGLSKLLSEDRPEVSLTRTHQVMGTLGYMAPEQMEGSRDVDHRADIYSLGVVFYELLTGELPLGRFSPPSEKVQIDVRLDEVVLRSLEKDPERRYQQASELKTDIESLPKDAHVGPPSVAGPASLLGEIDIDAARQAVKGPAIGLMIVGIVNLVLLVLPLVFLFSFVLLADPSPRKHELAIVQPSVLPLGSTVLADVDTVLPSGGMLIQPSALLLVVAQSDVRWLALLPVLLLVGTLILSLPIAGVLILGGRKMSKLDLYPLAVLASVLALLPCHPGFVIGLPIGIWSLIVLMRPDVKAAFALKSN